MRPWLLAALASSLTACLTTGPIPCEESSECYRGQACISGVCGGSTEGELDACQAPTLTSCQDPDEADERNDARNEATPLNRGDFWGCDPADPGDDHDPITVSSILCPDEPGDFYQIAFVACRDRDFEVVARMTPTPACGEGFARLRSYFNGAELLCDDPNNSRPLRCTKEGDTLVRAVTVPAGLASIGSIYFGVDGNDADAVTYDYDLTIEYEEPEP